MNGLTISIKRNPTAPPIYGPKYGIILVIPTTTLIRTAYGNRNITIAIKHIIPMISESSAFPNIKLVKYVHFRVVHFLKCWQVCKAELHI